MADDPVPREKFVERAAKSAVTQTAARYTMIWTGFLMTFVVVPGGGWVAVRFVAAIDRTAEKQEAMGQKFAGLEQQVINIASSQVQNSRNIAERIESGERVLNDRINAQATWIQQLSTEMKDLIKKVYSMTASHIK